MFQKNDKYLKYAQVALGLFLVILGFAVFILGICRLFEEKGNALLIWLIGGLLVWLLWIFGNLFFCFLADVKLIRNKLYGCENKGLEDFIDENSKKKNTSPNVYSHINKKA